MPILAEATSLVRFMFAAPDVPPNAAFPLTRKLLMPLGRCLVFLLGFGLLFGFASSRVAFAEQVAGVNSAKAAFIYNFLKFTEWPAEAFASPDAPIVICVNRLSPELESNIGKLDGRVAQGHAIKVVATSSWARVGECHMLVFGEDPPDRIARVPDSVLTVGQSSAFLEQGGMIGLSVENERLIFDINLENLHRSQLRISSQLMRLARNLRKK